LHLAAISQHNQNDQITAGASGQGVRFDCTTKRITKRNDVRYINKDHNNLAYDTHDLEPRFAYYYCGLQGK
jgi:hypothetical protein